MKSLFAFYLLAVLLSIFSITQGFIPRSVQLREQKMILQMVLNGEISIEDVDPELFRVLPRREIHARG